MLAGAHVAVALEVLATALVACEEDVLDLGVVLSEAEHVGVPVEFVTEPLDASPEGQLIRFVRGYAAKVEHEKIKERTQRGKLARVAAGKPLVGQKAAYGYQWADADKSMLSIDATTAPIVRRLFAGVLAGASLRALALALTGDGIPTPTGRGLGWSMTTVRHILLNPVYTGRLTALRWRADRVDGGYRHTLRAPEEQRVLATTVPALIDDATFAAAADRLSRNKAYATRNNRHLEATLLRGGFVRCAECGRSMTVGYQKTWRRWAYVCGQRTGQGECRPRPFVDASALDAKVWEKLEAILVDPQIVAGEIERMRRDDPTADDLAAVDQALREIARKQRKGAQAVTLLDDDAAAPVLVELATLAKQKQQLEGERVSLLGRREGWEAAQGRLDELTAWCAGVAANLSDLTYAQRRLALEALGISVRVWRAGHTPRYEITASILLDGAIVTRTTARCSSRCPAWTARCRRSAC
jgi:site-specific DNA recombinase